METQPRKYGTFTRSKRFGAGVSSSAAAFKNLRPERPPFSRKKPPARMLLAKRRRPFIRQMRSTWTGAARIRVPRVWSATT
jgi:hypothetical protein